MRDFGLRMDEAYDLPVCQAVALHTWNSEANPWCRMKLVSDGYIQQERYRRRETALCGESALPKKVKDTHGE